jgi:signal transduction histidine kinase/ligand-binding sensor domain-containing protein/DNA-binding response OmpR family regulator
MQLNPVQAYFFRSYQVEDGLSHNCVWAVMQDKCGVMWFGTMDGLNRFDGKSIKIYRKQPEDTLSIGSSYIHCLKEDSQGRFFVGTKQGLYLFDRITETFSHVTLNDKKWGEDNTSIARIMEDSDGNIWLGCFGQGLYVLNPDLTVKRHYCNNNIPSNYLWTVAQDYNGVIWIGTDDVGLLRFDPDEETFTLISQDKNMGLTDPTIYSLYCDIDNNIWIGTAGSGLCRFSYRTGKMSVYKNQPGKKVFNIKSIIEMSEHELLMGSDNGLIRFDKNKELYHLMNKETSFDNITDKSIFSIVKDKENNFWIATYFGGVNYYSPEINKFSFYPGSYELSPGRNIVSSFVEDENGRIWIGTNNKGLSLFHAKTSAFEQVEQKLGYHDIQHLMLDNDELWVSLYGQGIRVLDIKNNHIRKNYVYHPQKDNSLASNFVNTIFKTSKGVIILGTSEGANYINPSDKKLREYDYLKGISIKDITEDYNGSVWFASHLQGLLRLSASGEWDSFMHRPGDSASLIGNNINYVFQDARRYRIWVGTEGEGIKIFSLRDNRFEYTLNVQNGLPSNIVYAIVDDADGNVWASTGGGLIRIDPGTMNVRTFKYAESLYKIKYNRNCCLRASDNRLYFGGTNGFILFDPKDITENRYIPPVMITGFQISGKEIIPGAGSSPLTAPIANTEKITLEHSQSTFSFDFVTLSYMSPSQNEYAYMLEGFDNEWHYTDNTNNKAVYMNIPSGKYTFRVKGANSSGIWNEDGPEIVIHIKPPFWMSGMMLIVYVILVSSLIFYIVRLYKRRLVANNNEKLYKYKTEKEKEMYESKIGFFTNIAHEIRTPLSLIVAPLENIILSGDGSHQTKENLDIIKRNTNRLLELINQLLDFRKIEEDMFRLSFKKQNVMDIIRKIYHQYADNAEIRNIRVEFPGMLQNINGAVDAEALCKIVSNLMSNAIKYARQKVRIEVKTEKNNLHIIIEDDGIGMNESYLKKIFEPFFQIDSSDNSIKTGSGLGLSLSQSLAVKHGGSISVKSEQNKGSVFTLTIPFVLTEDIIQENVSSETIQEGDEASSLLQDNATHNRNLTILLVEDNEELRSFLSDSLSSSFTVFEAGNGIEALEIVEKEIIDVIITDILMPDMDGMELCHRLKTNPDYSYIPLIVLSAKTDTSTKVEGLNAGADVYMEKPFSLEQLKAQINSIIENRNHIRDNFIKSPLHYYKQKPENTENAYFIEKINTIILEHIVDEKFSIDNLSEKFFMSRSNFHKKIKNITGMTPNDYIKLIRLNQSILLLSTGKYKINEVCYMVGFNTPSYFSKCFFEQFGKLPKDFIQND